MSPVPSSGRYLALWFLHPGHGTNAVKELEVYLCEGTTTTDDSVPSMLSTCI